MLADFSERTHVLILLGTVGTYGIVAPGAHVSRCAERVLDGVGG
ncbi:MAG: hypothetical protein ACKVWV_17315 [Planctomycetota bacterium]